MILAGIWFGQQHPPLNTFMEPISKELHALEQTGITLNSLDKCCAITNIINFIIQGAYLTLTNGEKIHTKAFVLSGVYDVPAKSDALGFVNHRGKYACTRCLNPGKVLRTEKG